MHLYISLAILRFESRLHTVVNCSGVARSENVTLKARGKKDQRYSVDFRLLFLHPGQHNPNSGKNAKYLCETRGNVQMRIGDIERLHIV